MCRNSVILLISLSVGFLDSLHDASADVTSHDIPDVAIPMNKHPLMLSLVRRSIPEPVTVVHFSQANQVPPKEIPQAVVGWLLSITHTCRPRHSMLTAAKWVHQAITWTNVDLSSVRSSGIHLNAILQEMPQPSVTEISLKINYLTFFLFKSLRGQWVK